MRVFLMHLIAFYMLDIGQRATELMFPIHRHTDENNDYLYIYDTHSPETAGDVIGGPAPHAAVGARVFVTHVFPRLA